MIRIKKTFALSALIASCLFAVSALSAVPASGISHEPPAQTYASLLSRYHLIEKVLSNSPLALPVYFESSVDKNYAGAEIYGIIYHPFEKVKKELSTHSNWCDIVLLHTNVRACTYSKTVRNSMITLYNVNRHYHHLNDAYLMNFIFGPISDQPSFFDVEMTAESGPFSSRDHKFRLRAIPLDAGRTFIQLVYSYRYNSFQYLAMKSFFALFGAGNVGFTVTASDSQNNPVYVSGVRGAIERNIMRYYLAFLAFFDSLDLPQNQRVEQRFGIWYDFTSKYKKQFPEMDKREYIQMKQADLKNQFLLQSERRDHVK
jgi:hypothetical protein